MSPPAPRICYKNGTSCPGEAAVRPVGGGGGGIRLKIRGRPLMIGGGENREKKFQRPFSRKEASARKNKFVSAQPGPAAYRNLNHVHFHPVHVKII